MLHPFYYHYYANLCYVLLCLLYQQQSLLGTAAGLTMIIDGATINEWATRDEYQRLMAAVGIPGNGRGGATLRVPDQTLDSQVGGGGGAGSGEPVSQPQQLQQLIGDQQDQQRSGSAADELQLALDRLEVIEEETRQVKLLRDLQKLEHQLAAATTSGDGTASNGGRLQQQHYQQLLQQQQQRINSEPVSGARTLSDLVPVGDTNLENPLRHLKERGSSPKRYCGDELINVLEIVCQSRFYDGEFEPEIVKPIVTKRFAEYDQQQPEDINQQQQQQQQSQTVSRRRKLRTLNDSVHSAKADDTDGNQQQQQQQQLYLLSSNSSGKNQNTRSANLNINQNNNNQRTINNNRQAKLLLYRRIRGASAECCQRPCKLEELQPYCKKP